MSLSNPTIKDIKDGDTATILTESKLRTWIAKPVRKLVCLFKGHTKVTLQNAKGEEVVKSCFRCWKKFK